MILVTGAAGFIGSNFVLDWLAQSDEPVVNLDALTYAGHLESIEGLFADDRVRFVRGDIADREAVLVHGVSRRSHLRCRRDIAQATDSPG